MEESAGRKGKRHTSRKGDTVLLQVYTIHFTTDRYVITSIIAGNECRTYNVIYDWDLDVANGNISSCHYTERNNAIDMECLSR